MVFLSFLMIGLRLVIVGGIIIGILFFGLRYLFRYLLIFGISGVVVMKKLYFLVSFLVWCGFLVSFFSFLLLIILSLSFLVVLVMVLLVMIVIFGFFL